jgi:hypothetical protein
MANNEESETKKGVNVVDRRRFDSSGEARSDAEPKAVESVAVASAEVVGQGFKMEDAAQEEEVAFGSFIMSLATQVLVQLGEMPAPGGLEIPVDLNASRQTIEIIAMLQRRTRGNVSAEEAHFLEEVLHSLRTSFVARSKKAP